MFFVEFIIIERGRGLVNLSDVIFSNEGISLVIPLSKVTHNNMSEKYTEERQVKKQKNKPSRLPLPLSEEREVVGDFLRSPISPGKGNMSSHVYTYVHSYVCACLFQYSSKT